MDCCPQKSPGPAWRRQPSHWHARAGYVCSGAAPHRARQRSPPPRQQRALTALASLQTEPPLVNGWTSSYNGVLEATESVSFTVLVKEQNLDQLTKTALEVSDPESPKYTQYLTQLQIDQLTAPKASDVQTVRTWLATQTSCIVAGHKNRVFTVKCSAEAAGALLSTSFRRLHNRKTGQRAVRASHFALPSKVEAACHVQGLHGLPLPPKPSMKASERRSLRQGPGPQVHQDPCCKFLQYSLLFSLNPCSRPTSRRP